jgi:hypothetical protein
VQWLGGNVSKADIISKVSGTSVFNLGLPKRQQLGVNLDWIQCLLFFFYMLM